MDATVTRVQNKDLGEMRTTITDTVRVMLRKNPATSKIGQLRRQAKRFQTPMEALALVQ